MVQYNWQYFFFLITVMLILHFLHDRQTLKHKSIHSLLPLKKRDVGDHMYQVKLIKKRKKHTSFIPLRTKKLWSLPLWLCLRRVSFSFSHITSLWRVSDIYICSVKSSGMLYYKQPYSVTIIQVHPSASHKDRFHSRLRSISAAAVTSRRPEGGTGSALFSRWYENISLSWRRRFHCRVSSVHGGNKRGQIFTFADGF